MIFAGEGLFLLELGLLVYCVLNIITTPPDEVRNLPRLLWLLLVVVLPLVGGIAWLVAGRPVRLPPAGAGRGRVRVPAEYDRPGRAVAAAPDDDEQFLLGLRQRADAQRREAERLRREELAREEAERSEAWRRRHRPET